MINYAHMLNIYFAPPPKKMTKTNIITCLYMYLIVSLILITNSSVLHVSLNNMLRSVNNVGLS